MRRYGLVQVNACYTTDHEMELADDGEWVRYEEVEALLLQRAQEIEQVKAFLGEIVELNGCNDHVWLVCRSQELLEAALVSRAPQQADYDEAKRYLTSLFAHVAPQCKPLPTLSGLATQIDNYIAGLLAAPLPASAALQDLIAQWRAEAHEALEKWPRGAILPSKKLRQCADQLEAALQGIAIPHQDEETK